MTAGAMAAAGFIPFVGWAGRVVKGGSAVYKTTKGMSAAYQAMALYQTPKAFKTLEQTEKGLYGLVLTNGMYEYTTGKDVLGNKLTKEQQQASLFQTFGIAAGGVLASKASTQLVEKGAQAVTKKVNDMRNVVRTSKVTQYGKDIQQAMGKMPAAGIDKARKMYDAVLDAKVPRFLPQEVPVGVSADFAQQTVRDVLKNTAKNTMVFFDKIESNINALLSSKDSKIRTYRGIDLERLETKFKADPDLIVEMPFEGKGMPNTNSEGWLCNANYYWKEMLSKKPEAFSAFNQAIINGKHPKLKTPTNDATFRKHFPQYDLEGLRGKPMVHHHIGGGGQAIAVPKPLHPGFGGIHNPEKELGIWGKDSKYAELLQRFIEKEN